MKNGFTLIEMIVVLAVISMLVSYVMASYVETKARSRDAKRESDMKQLQEGLAIYATIYHLYPVCPPNTRINGDSDCLSSAMLNANAMNTMPIDPLRGAGSCPPADGNYVYCYESDGFNYTLRYVLETVSIVGKSPGTQTLSP